MSACGDHHQDKPLRGGPMSWLLIQDPKENINENQSSCAHKTRPQTKKWKIHQNRPKLGTIIEDERAIHYYKSWLLRSSNVRAGSGCKPAIIPRIMVRWVIYIHYKHNKGMREVCARMFQSTVCYASTYGHQRGILFVKGNCTPSSRGRFLVAGGRRGTQKSTRAEIRCQRGLNED